VERCISIGRKTAASIFREILTFKQHIINTRSYNSVTRRQTSELRNETVQEVNSDLRIRKEAQVARYCMYEEQHSD
jgi:hypothetical protein